jgi:hypothetical protein
MTGSRSFIFSGLDSGYVEITSVIVYLLFYSSKLRNKIFSNNLRMSFLIFQGSLEIET